jgi:hypothetical protein
MRGRSPIDTWVFIEKPLECRGGDSRRRTPADFPLLQCGKFGWYAGRSECADRFGLAEIVGLAPRFEAQNDRCGRSLRSQCFVLLGKEPFKRRRSHGLGGGTRSFPLLKRADFYRQTGVYEHTHRLRLAKAVNRPPSFEFCDYGMKRLARHESMYHDDSGSRWQLVVTEIWAKCFKKKRVIYRLLTYSISVYNGSGRLNEQTISDILIYLWKWPSWPFGPGGSKEK